MMTQYQLYNHVDSKDIVLIPQIEMPLGCHIDACTLAACL